MMRLSPVSPLYYDPQMAAAKASGYAHTPINYLWKGLLNGKRKQKLYYFFSRDC